MSINVTASIRLSGYAFFQQFRKCGKANCTCNRGLQHGPYWYKRNLENGKVSYIGKNLDGLTRYILNRFQNHRSGILAVANGLERQAYILRKFAKGLKLTRSERLMIEPLGFNDMYLYLVSGPGSQATQDQQESNGKHLGDRR